MKCSLNLTSQIHNTCFLPFLPFSFKFHQVIHFLISLIVLSLCSVLGLQYNPLYMHDISISLFNLIYDFSTSFSFSSCQRRIHFACVTSSLLLRAINLSLNYHSRDKLRGPPQAHDWSSLHYHYFVTPSGLWLLVSPIVSGRR